MSELLAPSQMVKGNPQCPAGWASPGLTLLRNPTSRQLASSRGSISSRTLPNVPHGVSRCGLWSGPRLCVLWPHTLHDGQFSSGARQLSSIILPEDESQVGEIIQVVHGWMMDGWMNGWMDGW